MKNIPTHAVKAVITNDRGEILFLQRNAAKRADMKSNWDFAGGLVEKNEDDKTALAREVKEELGVKSVVGQKLGTWTFYRKFDGKTVQATNYAVTVQSHNFTLSKEHVAAKWVSPAAMRELEVKDKSIFNALG